MAKREKAGAFWLREAKNGGQKFMSGVVDVDLPSGTNVVMFKNRYKEAGDNKPDYMLYLDAPSDDSQEF